MDELQTDTLSDYRKNQSSSFESSREDTACAAALLNGCDDEEDLMDHCETESIGGNSDVWKGSDSEEENFESTNEDVATSTPRVEVEDKTLKTTEPYKVELEAANEPESTQVEDKESKDVEEHKPEEEKTGGGAETSDKVTEEPPKKETENKETEESGEVATPKEPGEDNKPPKEPPTKETEETNPTTSEIVEVEPDVEDLTQSDSLQEKDPLDTSKDQNNVDDDCQMDYDAEDDDDFDPSLLCPEVSMAVDDNPVVTTNGEVSNEGGSDTASTFIDEVTGVEISFNLTPEELELRKRLYGPTNPVQITKLHCTACNIHLGSALEGQNNRFVHPLLKVLICKKCYHFYTSGEFEKDEDGSELYCRWCGQGGQVLCCSKCEYVFCKRCIRTNFGRKKMFEIRDSDNWDCFRCNSSQLITQRIMCFEFFEYLRREMSRAATLKSPEVWSKDYSRCCGPKKRPLEGVEEGKKAKKKKMVMDPDYNPLGNEIKQSVPNLTSKGFVNKGMSLQRPIQILPMLPRTQDNDIEFVRQIPAPQVTINTVPRPTYQTILPATIIRPVLQPPTLVRISQPAPPLLPTGRILNATLQKDNSTMKHEWFEKTVRATARVNSHLSYTLTQLNKAQNQAASIEELAVVHNKLQEILSSSINSLIQIRKNLRTEFIAGIKTVRLPSKKAETFSNDDDVIFVSAPSTSTPIPVPSTSRQVPVVATKSTLKKTSFVTTKPAKGYLKVKSFKELQNVPSECITIPDDTPPPSTTKPVCNGSNETDSKETEPEASSEKKVTVQCEVPKEKATQPPQLKKETRRRNNNLIYDLNEKPNSFIQRMMDVKVRLPNDNLVELQKKWNSKKK